MIAMSALVSNPNAKLFNEQLSKAIDEMQAKGLIVEVKYQTHVWKRKIVYSAVLLGRLKGE